MRTGLLLNYNTPNAVALQVNAVNKCSLTASDLYVLVPCYSSYDNIERLLKNAGADTS